MVPTTVRTGTLEADRCVDHCFRFVAIKQEKAFTMIAVTWIAFVGLAHLSRYSHSFVISNSRQWQGIAREHVLPSYPNEGELHFPAVLSSSAATTASKDRALKSEKGATHRYFAVKALMPRKGSVAFAVDRLESSLNYGKLSVRDRSFCRLLVTTAERRLGQIDAVLAACQTKGGSGDERGNTLSRPRNHKNYKADQFVEAVLRIGATQLLFLNTPAHAAVKETVDVLRLSKDIKVTEAKLKYANAILRRLSREGSELLASVTDVTANAAPWLVEEWKLAWGEETTKAIIAAAMQETPRCLTVNLQRTLSKRGSSHQHQQQQIEATAALFDKAEILPQGSIRVAHPPPGPVSTWPLYKEGAWWCQDASATIPAIALYQALSQWGSVAVDNMHVIDLCAAPGGKTAQLSNYGFSSVTALEVSANRCERLRQNMERLRMSWNIVVADGCEWSPPPHAHAPVDAVLVDVPCTATGTGSKRPDVLRRSADYRDLVGVQQRLACHAADTMVKVGGILVYATCSLLKQESEDQVTKLLSREGGAQLETMPFQPGEIPGFDEAIDTNGWIRVLPGALEGSLGQCDGFFVARLKRIS